MTDKLLTLNNGYKIPSLGLGTWQSPPGAVEAAVEYALTHGVKHIDCAYAYQNEEEVGRGIKKALAAGIKREDFFITTKVPPPFHSRVEQCLNESLANLQLEYVDLLLVHWPVGLNPHGNHKLVPTRPDGSRDLDPDFSVLKTWRQFEKLAKEGKRVRSVGVSNFSVPYLTDLLKDAEVVPAVNQIENHPLLPQTEVVEFCKDKGIVVEAYSPFGSTGGPLFQNKTVLGLAEKHGVAPGTILLSFHISSDRVALPKTTSPARIEENKKVVQLSPQEIKLLEDVHLTEGKHRFAKPPWGVDLKFPDWDASKQ